MGAAAVLNHQGPAARNNLPVLGANQALYELLTDSALTHCCTLVGVQQSAFACTNTYMDKLPSRHTHTLVYVSVLQPRVHI